MYIDIEENDNLDEPVMATFAATGPATRLRTIRLWNGQAWRWCAICACGPTGIEAAWIQPIEESGDGPALLVTGGPWGLRLAEIDGPEASAPLWDYNHADQWGEGFLICRPDLHYRP